MIDSISINGVDLRTLGFGVRSPDGIWDDIAVTGDGTSVPGRIARLAPTVITSSARVITIVGTLSGTTRADFLAKLHKLKAWLSAPSLSVIRAEEPTLVYTARKVGTGVTPTGPVFRQRRQELSISLVCDDPLAHDSSDTIITPISSSPVAIPQGTAPSYGVIRIVALAAGPGTAINPVLTYRNSAGVVVATMGFTRTLAFATSDYLEIDLDHFSVKRSVSGVITNDLPAQTSGDFFQLSPLDGVYGSSSWPTLEVNVGAATLTYRRAWR